MDDCRFDNLTRMLGGLRDRRAALRDLTGAGLALVALARAEIGLAQDDDVLIEGCRLTGEECRRNNNCCSGHCKRRKRRDRRRRRDGGDGDRRRRRKDRRREDGKCQCLSNGKSCNKDAACCRGFCDRNENRCRCTPNGDTCNRDDDCCRGRCREVSGGQRFCSNN